MADTHFSGPVDSAAGFKGNITGNVVGNVTGNLTGNATGTQTGPVVSSSVNIGSGGALTYVHRASVSVDLPSIATVSVAEVSVTVTGAAVGDTVIANPPATLTAGLCQVGARVSATNTVLLRIYNATGGPIDEAAGNWAFALIR